MEKTRNRGLLFVHWQLVADFIAFSFKRREQTVMGFTGKLLRRCFNWDQTRSSFLKAELEFTHHKLTLK